MTDIVSHIVTIGFGLLLFFAVLYELVMTFRRKKKECKIKMRNGSTITYTEGTMKGAATSYGDQGWNKPLLLKTTVTVDRGQPDKRTQEASEALNVENIEAKVKSELMNMEDWNNYTNCHCKTCGGAMEGDGYNVVLHCETLDATELYLEPDADPVYCKPQEKDKDEEV